MRKTQAVYCAKIILMNLFFTCDLSQNFWWGIKFEWNTDMELIVMDMLLDIHTKIFAPKISILLRLLGFVE